MESFIPKNRLEAFTDGVIAIILTIMVLELKVPHGAELSELRPLLPVFFSYILSFIGIGIYWNNHHHLFHAVKRINGTIMWANLHLLFWLSLVPFVTNWFGENLGQTWPTFLYGAVLWMAGFSYNILQRRVVVYQGKDSTLATAIGNDIKGIISLVLYTLAVGVSLFYPWVSDALYVIVAAMWFIPDRRIEQGQSLFAASD